MFFNFRQVVVEEVMEEKGKLLLFKICESGNHEGQEANENLVRMLVEKCGVDCKAQVLSLVLAIRHPFVIAPV